MNWYKKIAMPMANTSELPYGYYIKPEISSDFATFTITNRNEDEDEGNDTDYDYDDDYDYGYDDYDDSDDIQGNIEIRRDEDNRDLWYVAGVEADDGFGPLLYDIAMEYVTTQGGHLTSNANHHRVDDLTSRDAKGVWDYYENYRNDVKRVKSPLGFTGYQKDIEHLQFVLDKGYALGDYVPEQILRLWPLDKQERYRKAYEEFGDL